MARFYGSSAVQARLLRQWLTSASAIIVFGGVAQAQTAPPPLVTNAQQPTAPADQAPAPAADGAASGQEVRVIADDIVVTGYRRSIETSLARKRDANAFIDVITAEDVGKFPDKNVADSLQRVPGVVIERDGGEGSRVSIRGLQSDLTLTELNGNFIAGADTGDPSRSFNYLLLPSNMIGSIDVYKSPEARLDEGGVGGTIILHTRRPLDLKPWSGFVSAEGTIADVTEKVEPQVSGQLSWHNASGTLGLLLGGTYQKRTNREMNGSTESWQWWTDGGRDGIKATDVNGRPIANDAAVSYWSQNRGETTQSGQHYNGYWAPQSVNESILVSERERIGAQATLEWKPTDNLRLTANYFRFQLNSETRTNALKIPEWGYDNFFTAAKFDKSNTVLQSATFQVPNAGTGCLTQTPICTMETPQLAGIYSKEKDVSNTFDLHGDWSQDRLSVSFIAGKTRSTGGPSQQFQVAAKPRLTGTVTQNGNFLSSYDYSGGGLAMAFSPELQRNLMNGIAQIDTGSTGSGFTNSSIEQKYGQVDVTRKFGGVLEAIQVGAKWRDGKITRRTGELNWYADPATLLRFQDTAQGAVAQPSFFYDQPISNIPGGFTATSFPGVNLDNYLEYLNKTYGNAVTVPQPQNLYQIKERIWAGYVEANFKAGPVRGNIGVRIANTKQSGTSTDTIYREIDYCRDGPGGPFSPAPIGADGNCQVLPQSQREIREFSPNNESKSYTDVLPSFNISWDVTSNVLLRGAVSKVVARPAFNDLAAARSLTFNSDAYTYDRNQFGEVAGWSGNGGNFGLKPFSAWAYDLGAEWYFHRGSVIGAALFRKDVKNFVVPLVLDLTQTVQGQQVLVRQYSTQANGASAVSEGVELYAQHTLDFGLGAQVNFTYNHTSTADVSLNGTKIGTSPLVGSAKTQWNASVFYEKHGVLLRASYNRKGEQVGGIVSGLNIYSDPYEQVDLNGLYNLTDHISLTASVINLTKSEQRAHLGNDTSARYYSSQYTGRRFYTGVQWTF
ncbi:TonB-dependent receptor [Sphingomonas echinoides]|uniref:TonB-dependent receptor n=1 Tax=Sphingomonas echinoides TaxID=59803 RepID=UPI002412F2A2|nr:TonB-dependent receptor [Sphingomonas echinoides]